MGPLEPPEPLNSYHGISQFSSGVTALDAWLQGKSRLNEAKGSARTYVVYDCNRVAGSYSLAAIVVQAVDERARTFCGRYGFRPYSEREPLLLRMSEIASLLRH